jgi:hypothetical protein
MSDKEDPINLAIESEAPAKKPKKKRELTDEQRAKLKENLAKGRATALANRRKKMLEKKIDKQDAERKRDEKIAQSILNQKNEKEQIKELKDQIDNLKAEKKSTGIDHSEEIKSLREQLIMVGKVVDGVLQREKASASRKVVKEPENTVVKQPVKIQEEPKPQPVAKPEPKIFDASAWNKRGLRGLI